MYGEETLEQGTVVGGKIVQPEIFARHLTHILATAHGGPIRTRRVVVAIPEEKVFIQIVTIPKVDVEKIPDVIRWQSEKLISFSLESVSMDYTVIEENATTMKVCITAAPQDVVDACIVTLGRLGCTVIALDTHSDALARLFATQPHMLSLLVSVEPKTATLVVAKNNVARFASVIAFDGDAHILEEKINETMRFYYERKELDKKVGEIVLFGDIQSLILGGAQDRLGVPMRWVKFHELFKQAGSDSLNPYIINAGLFSKHNTGINLLPRDMKQLIQKDDIRSYALGVIRAAITVCIILGIIVAIGVYWQMQQKAQLDAQLIAQTHTPEDATRVTLEKNVTQLNARLQKMKKISIVSPSTHGYIDAVIAQFPATGSLSSIEYTSAQKTITLEGLLPDRTTLIAYRDALKAQKGVASVSVPISNYDTATDIPFTITLTLQ